MCVSVCVFVSQSNVCVCSITMCVFRNKECVCVFKNSVCVCLRTMCVYICVCMCVCAGVYVSA